MVAWPSWAIRGPEMLARWEGLCQNSVIVSFIFVAMWCVELTILVMLEGLAEHAEGCEPEGLLGLGGSGGAQDADDILQHVAGITGDDGLEQVRDGGARIELCMTYLESAEKDLEELVECREARYLGLFILLGSTGSGPLDETEEDGSESAVV